MTQDETCRCTAEEFEKKVAQIYISSTLEAILFETAALSVIFIRAGFSAFTLMQAIGFSLLILFIISAVIFWRKKNLKIKMLNSLEKNRISESTFIAYIKQNPAEFEFIQALLIPPVKIKE